MGSKCHTVIIIIILLNHHDNNYARSWPMTNKIKLVKMISQNNIAITCILFYSITM